MSTKRKGMSDESDDCPEMHYWMNESLSNVFFVIDGQALPALKSLLSVKNNVFRVMFSGQFKEATDKEVVIKETTFEAFQTFIRFLYFDELVIKDKNDFNLIDEIWKLCDRYEASRLRGRLIGHLTGLWINFQNMESIQRIAFDYKIEELMSNVMDFIENNFKHFIAKDNKELVSLNGSTDNRLLEVMADKYRKVRAKYEAFKRSLNKIKKWQCSCGVFNNDLEYGPYTTCRSCSRNYLSLE